MRFAFLLLLLACPLKAADQDYLLTVPEYKRGLQELRGYFVKRNEDPAVAELYIKNLENAFPAELGRPVPVTRGVFQDF
ncbi:MAG: hypothetical protein M0D55_15395 [Elusimicrobiota bacterium]|nr:MAG: hypothetical protein M0D55_15395 [Elusimicrobiota bacterium]